MHWQKNSNWEELSAIDISGSTLYLTFLCQKFWYKVLFMNFEPEDIKVNEFALEEMVWIFLTAPLNRIELVFVYLM